MSDGKQPPKIPSPNNSGFQSADKIQGPSEESIRNNELFRNLLAQWDLAVEWAEAKTPEGWSKNIEVSNPLGAIKVTMAPPPTKWEPRTNTAFKRPEPAAFDIKKVEAIVFEQPDLLEMKDGKVFMRKFLGDLYTGINDKMKLAGMQYNKKSADGSVQGHWSKAV